jgi:hypothetical protein
MEEMASVELGHWKKCGRMAKSVQVTVLKAQSRWFPEERK